MCPGCDGSLVFMNNDPHPGQPLPPHAAAQPQAPVTPAQPPYGYPYAAQQSWPQQMWPATPPPAPAPKNRAARRALLGAAGAALAAGLVLSGVAIGNATQSSGSTTASAGTGSSSTGTGTGTGSTGTGSSGSGTTQLGPGSFGGSGTGSSTGGGSDSGQTSASVATATQQKGIVTIVSVLGYDNAESAGTGMVLTSNGEILTNNHVIDGATSITVTVETTGKSYQAKVVGTDPTDDVAVLQLANASGLTTATVGAASDVDDLAVGDKVTGVGNGGGTGTLTSAAGTVTALNQSITASDETGQGSETLSGLIETNAPIIAGDSGGPLYDSDGTIIGMDTAGSSSSQSTAATTAYAIPIDNALTIADKIESGTQTSTIHLGLPAFLGVGVSDTSTDGAGITSVVSGGPAADAGITAGSTITAVGSTSVTSADTLGTALAGYEPGDKVAITWRDAAGDSHTATVTLATGPAD